MSRFLALNALLFTLCFASVGFAQTNILERSGTLQDSDPVSADGAHYDQYTIELQENDWIIIEMTAEDFDAYVVLRASDGQIVETNDDGDFYESGTNSKLEYRAEAAGTFTILATSLFPESRGAYTIKAHKRR